MSPLNITQPLDSIRYMVYNGYYKVMSNIPKMGHLTTPVKLCWFCWTMPNSRNLNIISSGYDIHSLPWNITMLLIGKPSINGPFSMAMLNNQRVNMNGNQFCVNETRKKYGGQNRHDIFWSTLKVAWLLDVLLNIYPISQLSTIFVG